MSQPPTILTILGGLTGKLSLVVSVRPKMIVIFLVHVNILVQYHTMNDTETLLKEIKALKARVKELEDKINGIYISVNEI